MAEGSLEQLRQELEQERLATQRLRQETQISKQRVNELRRIIQDSPEASFRDDEDVRRHSHDSRLDDSLYPSRDAAYRHSAYRPGRYGESEDSYSGARDSDWRQKSHEEEERRFVVLNPRASKRPSHSPVRRDDYSPTRDDFSPERSEYKLPDDQDLHIPIRGRSASRERSWEKRTIRVSDSDPEQRRKKSRFSWEEPRSNFDEDSQRYRNYASPANERGSSADRYDSQYGPGKRDYRSDKEYESRHGRSEPQYGRPESRYSSSGPHSNRFEPQYDQPEPQYGRSDSHYSQSDQQQGSYNQQQSYQPGPAAQTQWSNYAVEPSQPVACHIPGLDFVNHDSVPQNSSVGRPDLYYLPSTAKLSAAFGNPSSLSTASSNAHTPTQTTAASMAISPTLAAANPRTVAPSISQPNLYLSKAAAEVKKPEPNTELQAPKTEEVAEKEKEEKEPVEQIKKIEFTVNMLCPVPGCPDQTFFATRVAYENHWISCHRTLVDTFRCHYCYDNKADRVGSFRHHLATVHCIHLPVRTFIPCKSRKGLGEFFHRVNQQYVSPKNTVFDPFFQVDLNLKTMATDPNLYPITNNKQGDIAQLKASSVTSPESRQMVLFRRSMVCPVDSCTSKKPFQMIEDLIVHWNSAHQESIACYVCRACRTAKQNPRIVMFEEIKLMAQHFAMDHKDLNWNIRGGIEFPQEYVCLEMRQNPRFIPPGRHIFKLSDSKIMSLKRRSDGLCSCGNEIYENPAVNQEKPGADFAVPPKPVNLREHRRRTISDGDKSEVPRQALQVITFKRGMRCPIKGCEEVMQKIVEYISPHDFKLHWNQTHLPMNASVCLLCEWSHFQATAGADFKKLSSQLQDVWQKHYQNHHPECKHVYSTGYKWMQKALVDPGNLRY